MRMNSRSGLRLAALAGISALAIVAVGLGVTSLKSRAPVAAEASGELPANTPAATSGGPSHAAGPASMVVMALPFPVYQLTYDPAGDALWFAVMEPGIGDWLYRVDPATGKSTEWELPVAPGNGFVSQVHVADDGAIWVSEDYRLVRLDPATGKVTSLVLDPSGQDIVPSVVEDPNLPGTWISSFTTDASGAILARNGVPLLTLVSSDLQIRGTVPLPDGFVGPIDIRRLPDGSLALLSGWSHLGELGIINGEGGLIASTSVEAGGNSRIAMNETGEMVISQAASNRYDAVASSEALLPGQSIGLWAVTADLNGGFVAYDGDAGVVYQIDPGKVTIELSMPPTHGTVCHLGSCQDVAAPADVTAMAVAARGTIWMIVGRDLTLVRADL